MRLTVQDCMRRISATVNQEASEPSAGGAEYLLWLEYMNRSVEEWAESNDWESLRKTFWPTVSGISGATVGLPLDYKKLAGEVIVYGDTETGRQFPEIIEEQENLYSTTDRYVTTTGNIADGFAVVFHPGTLASGASVRIQYYAMPTSLASPAQVPLIDDPQFLVDRTIAYILESRSDARFQLQETKARDRLLTMIENANLNKYNSYAGSTPVIDTGRRVGFRMGRD